MASATRIQTPAFTRTLYRTEYHQRAVIELVDGKEVSRTFGPLDSRSVPDGFDIEPRPDRIQLTLSLEEVSALQWNLLGKAGRHITAVAAALGSAMSSSGTGPSQGQDTKKDAACGTAKEAPYGSWHNDK